MARLAFLTSLAPTLRADTGFEIANRCIIDSLRAQGHSVRVFAFARPDDELRPDPDLILLGRMEIENSRVGRLAQLRWLAGAFRRRLPVACAKLRVGGSGVLRRIKADGPFDAIVASGVTMIGAYSRVADLAPLCFVQHNVEHRSARENAAFAGNAVLRGLFAREARLLERIERGLCRQSRHVWFLSEEDRQAFAEETGDRASVLPLLNAQAAQIPAGEPEHDVGLIGTWTWEPNLIGLRWFIEEIAPFLPRGFRMAVAGRTPVGLSAPANVALLGRVPTRRPSSDRAGPSRWSAARARASSSRRWRRCRRASPPSPPRSRCAAWPSGPATSGSRTTRGASPPRSCSSFPMSGRAIRAGSTAQPSPSARCSPRAMRSRPDWPGFKREAGALASPKGWGPAHGSRHADDRRAEG